MKLKDVLIDPSFAGLHWSIPSDTPDELRGGAHVNAAFMARAARDRTPYLSTHAGPFDTARMVYHCCGKSIVEIHAARLKCSEGPTGEPR